MFFGALFRRYRLLRHSCALWFQEDMAVIIEACVIMHNITVRERNATYTGTRVARVAADAAEAEDVGMTTYHKIAAPEEPIALVEWLHQGAGQVETANITTTFKSRCLKTCPPAQVTTRQKRAVEMSLTRGRRRS